MQDLFEILTVCYKPIKQFCIFLDLLHLPFLTVLGVEC